MTKEQAFNVVSLIQREPFYYRNFGVWWYHVKNELKRLGYDQDQLHHLGGFTDPIAEAYYIGKTTEQLDREAFSYQYAHTFHKRNGNQCATPDGETYLILDQDAE
jgi:hypothetical protein